MTLEYKSEHNRQLRVLEGVQPSGSGKTSVRARKEIQCGTAIQ